jgi:hypothetical protein
MKNFKAIPVVLFLALLIGSVYFSTSAYSSDFKKTDISSDVQQFLYSNGKLTKISEKPSGLCGFRVKPNFGCSCTSMFVCVDGASGGFTSPGDVIVWLDDGSCHTVCISCGSCAGSVVICPQGPSPCGGMQDVNVEVKAEGSCSCSGN